MQPTKKAEIVIGCKRSCNRGGVDNSHSSQSTESHRPMAKEPTDVEVPEQMVEQRPKPRARRHDRGLLLIGVFKLVEAVFFLLVGVGAIHFLHRDLRDAVLQLATKLRRDPEGRLVGFVLDHIDSITARRLREIGVATFLYRGCGWRREWGWCWRRCGRSI